MRWLGQSGGGSFLTPSDLRDPILGKTKLPSCIPYPSKPAVRGGLGAVAVPPRHARRPPGHSIAGGCRLQFPAASPAGPLCGCVSPSSAGSCRLQFPAASPAGPLCGCVSPSSAADCYLSGCTASPEAALLPRTMLGAVGGGRWRRSVVEAQGSDVVSSSLRALHKSLERTINESKEECVRPVKMIQKT